MLHPSTTHNKILPSSTPNVEIVAQYDHMSLTVLD